MSDVQITRVEEHYGYQVSWGALFHDGRVLKGSERIVSIKHGQVTISLGQAVTANGRCGPPQGTRGLVVALNIPNTAGRTTDIFDCLFEALMMEPRLTCMKLKDLEV